MVMYLDPRDLQEKHGFGDGDVPEQFLDWLDAAGVDYPSPDEWRDVLWALCRREWPSARLVRVRTAHNPVRVVEGTGVVGLAAVDVPWPEVARELRRSR